MSVKLKLIVLFIIIKLIPLLLITYIAIKGSLKLNEYFNSNTKTLYEETKNIIKSTSEEAISNSIKSLDKKSQKNLEKISALLAKNIASFLYERDKDLLFLSQTPINQKILQAFFNSKTRAIIIEDEYFYNDKTNKWEKKEAKIKEKQEKAINKYNINKFNIIQKANFKKKIIPLYKEITYFNLQGKELYKVSSINKEKLDISKKYNTYVKAENYFKEIQNLKKNEIYVSDVIGASVRSNIIGTFTRQKAEKAGIEFKPKNHGFAGLENPKGKKFEGIIRFVTPIFKDNKKVAYLSLALDHEHIMQFTDKFINPLEDEISQDIANASNGNYAFMWDYKGRNISHPRDYFITGFDHNTGQRIPPWLSQEIQEAFEKSKEKDLNEFLKTYPTFDNQSLKKKANLKQLRQKGEVGLDCRYLNFAPQCGGWMQVTKDGGYGSFVIFWSNVWKLTTAASIPYYTGKYKNSKRGFGFVTIGANLEEFHKAATKTKENIDVVLNKQSNIMETKIKDNAKSIANLISNLMDELLSFSILLILFIILIAIYTSNYISKRIDNLIKGTKEFAKNNLDYRIEITSKDEIGKLEESFNQMAIDLKREKEELEENERLMFHQSKMAAMGEMLENIAHQWRQPLSLISSASSSLILKKELSILEEDELVDSLDSIKNSTEYLSNTIDDFRTFFNPNKEMEKFNIINTIEKTLLIVKSKLAKNDVKIIKDYKDKYEISGFENELIQVIINILNNSQDAFELNKIKEKLIFISIKEEDSYLILKIKDTANGIPRDIIDRVFEPYFTTKHKAQGTGIGLYMSMQIITKNMKGQLSVENQSFKYKEQSFSGAEFTIRLPL